MMQVIRMKILENSIVFLKMLVVHDTQHFSKLIVVQLEITVHLF